MKNQITFVLVDDDAINNMLSEIHLEDEFPEAKIISFTNPDEAIEFFNKYSSDKNQGKIFLFLDINMPLMTGWEFLEQLEKKQLTTNNSLFTYILSSSVSQEDTKRADLNPNIVSFVEKPINMEFLNQLSKSFSLK